MRGLHFWAPTVHAAVFRDCFAAVSADLQQYPGWESFFLFDLIGLDWIECAQEEYDTCTSGIIYIRK